MTLSRKQFLLWMMTLQGDDGGKAHQFVIWQEVIGCNDVLVQLPDHSVPVNAILTGMSSTGPSQVSACCIHHIRQAYIIYQP